VDDDGASNDTVGSNELQEVVLVLVHESGNTFRISHDVTKISNVAIKARGATVSLLVGVVVGTSRQASVGVVTVLAMISLRNGRIKEGGWLEVCFKQCK